MLSPMVDAPIFVRIARENNLCAFVPGPPADEAKIEYERFKKMGALWSILEPYLVAYGRKHQEDADGLRVHQDQVTVKQLLREKLHPDDFEIERTEQLVRSSTVLMLDVSMSMAMRDNFLPAKKVTMALHSLISSQYPRDFLGMVSFSEVAREFNAATLPELSWDYVYGTNMQHSFQIARKMLSKQTGTKQIIMITDGEPTAHITPSGQPYFNYPPSQQTVDLTLAEVAKCTREDIRINTFVLDVTHYLQNFVEQISKMNGGRAFFTTNENLGDYVLMDFVDHKRSLVRGR